MDKFDPHQRIVEAFDKDPTAIQFIRDDGEGGFAAGVYRMAREIDRLRVKCGEPPDRDPSWQDREDDEIDSRLTDTEARKRYEHFMDNHPTIHTNRFTPWDQLSESQKQPWREMPIK